MSNTILQVLSEQRAYPVTLERRLTGGDINEVLLVASPQGQLVVKWNSATHLPGLFEKERRGLAALRTSQTFVVPEVYAVGKTEQHAYLVMEYLSPASPCSWEQFGEQLAQLHRGTAPQFGFPEWNYIGSLRQPNGHEDTAAAFLINQRLMPQFALAAEQNFHFLQHEKLYPLIEQLIPAEPPALIHGDLWNGNFLTTAQGFALIDPAVSYGLREMDLAMMHLFSGFPEQVFHTYEQYFPTAPGLSERIPIYQLYYLLVHLNIFGQAYYGQVQNVLSRYS